uniref:Uncharacterized protein n=1 Tax=Arundo donax TaxID=35708 RepID=A0A0A9ENE3_ARUDO
MPDFPSGTCDVMVTNSGRKRHKTYSASKCISNNKRW